jgi:hypothetical protein
VRSDPVIRLDLSYQVTFHFATANGAPIDQSAIRGITLKSTNGQVVRLRPGETPWLHGTRAVQVLGETQVRPIDWSVQRVEYAGSNVVNDSQQVFRPAEQQDVDVAVLFFHVDFRVTDAFFGFPQRGAIELVFPDGTAHRYPVDGDGRLSLPELPRGDYTLTSSGSGPDLTRPLAISRDQQVDLTFYSWLDILLALGGALVAAGGLAWWGRARRARPQTAAAVRADALGPTPVAVAAEPPADAPEGTPGDGLQPPSAVPAVTTSGRQA